MKLLTHNMLSCHIKGVKNGFPLLIEATKIVEHVADFDPGAGWRLGVWPPCLHLVLCDKCVSDL
jgi:hypothetical protein